MKVESNAECLMKVEILGVTKMLKAYSKKLCKTATQ